mmetsp:Transcript_70487/g.124207  ORF Transcript_70487/g.124207 Transcript_70487/m.124207 type:complete len:326 (-) Transcript_70487:1862-2839(-)
MWSLKTILYLGLSALLADGATINLVTYKSTSPGYVMTWSGGDMEYHCLYTPDGATGPTYVKGMYGLYGYFEGTVASNLTATVKYWSILPSTLPNLSQNLPAEIRYASNLATFTGDFGSFVNGWTAVNGTSNTSPNSTQLKQQCLWSYDTVDGSKPKTSGAWVEGTEPYTTEQWWVCDYNSTTQYGSYNYSYPPGADTQGYSVGKTQETNSSWITLGEDYDTVGQFAGSNYTYLAISLTASATATNPLELGGFYCDINTSAPFKTSTCARSPYTAGTTSATTNCAKYLDPSSPYAPASSPSPSGAFQVGPTLAFTVLLLCYQALAL